MGLFSSKKVSKSTTNNTTNVNERNVAMGAVQDGLSVAALDGSAVKIVQTDAGAIADAFSFTESALDKFADLQYQSNAVLGDAIGDVAEAKQSELKGTIDQILRYGTLALAIYFGARALTT